MKSSKMYRGWSPHGEHTRAKLRGTGSKMVMSNHCERAVLVRLSGGLPRLNASKLDQETLQMGLSRLGCAKRTTARRISLRDA